jgi:hypothetical protein
VLAGYPVVDVKVTLHLRLVPRGRLERERVQDGRVVRLQGRLPQGLAGDPRADDGGRGRDAGRLRRQRDGRPVVAARHGAGHGRHVGGGKIIKAEVPLSEMFGYSTTLRSMSQGRATYTMEFKHYSEAPKNVADAIITSRGK